MHYFLTKLFLFLLLILANLSLSNTTCPTVCGYGYCKDQAKCYCDQGYFGDDCMTHATQILVGTAQQGIIYDNWIYFYMPITEATHTLGLIFQKPADTIAKVYVNIQDLGDFTLPQEGSEGFTLYSANKISKKNYERSDLQADMGRKIVLGIYSDQGVSEIVVSASYESDTAFFPLNTALMVALVIGSVLVLLVIVICVLQSRINAGANYYAPPGEHHDVLTKEDAEHYFPAKEFSSFPNHLNQKTCCICLEDFKPDSMCMQLYCEHIHHDKCIEEWFEKHATCPECRKPMTLAVIHDYFDKDHDHDHEHEHSHNSHRKSIHSETIIVHSSDRT